MREPSDDPDAGVSLGYLDDKYVGKAAEELVGPTQWQILREFLRGLWGALQSIPRDQRESIDKKFQDFDLLNAAKYAGGYALGIAEGLWTSVKGLVEAVWTLLTLPYNVGKFIGEQVPPLMAKYGPPIAQLVMERDSLRPRLEAAIDRLLADPIGTSRQLGALLEAVKGLAMSKVRQLGRGLAGEALKLLELPWFDYGRSIGKVAGQILFEVILALASDAIGNLVKGALSAVGRLTARAAAGAAELLSSAGRYIGEAVEWIGGLARRAGGELGEMFESLRTLLNRLKALLSELGEEAALAGNDGVHLPIPSKGATVVESRAVKPPTRTAQATVADLTPPKVHPSKVPATTAKAPQPGKASFDEPLTAAEKTLTPEELRRWEIEREFDPAQPEYAKVTQESFAEEFGQSIRKTPGGRSIPPVFERGQLAHEYAELLISRRRLPRGLAKEVTVELPGGSVRLDRVDFERGVYYEIKPNTVSSRAAGADQIRIYAEYMNRNFPLPKGQQWIGRVVTYNRQRAIGMFGL